MPRFAITIPTVILTLPHSILNHSEAKLTIPTPRMITTLNSFKTSAARNNNDNALGDNNNMAER